MISDNQFLGFKWPPKMSSFTPKKRKHYEHLAVMVLNSDPDVAYVLKFSSEKKARYHVRSVNESNNAIAEYDKNELPDITEEGFIL